MKLIKIDASLLIVIRDNINTIPVTGAVDCGKIVGITNEINKLLSGEGDGAIHSEQEIS